MNKNSCRVCMNDNSSIPIFEVLRDNINYAEKIMEIAPVKISENDQLPQKICEGCQFTLLEIENFQNKCIQSDEMYQNLKKSLHDKISADTTIINEKKDKSDKINRLNKKSTKKKKKKIKIGKNTKSHLLESLITDDTYEKIQKILNEKYPLIKNENLEILNNNDEIVDKILKINNAKDILNELEQNILEKYYSHVYDLYDKYFLTQKKIDIENHLENFIDNVKQFLDEVNEYLALFNTDKQIKLDFLKEKSHKNYFKSLFGHLKTPNYYYRLVCLGKIQSEKCINENDVLAILTDKEIKNEIKDANNEKLDENDCQTKIDSVSEIIIYNSLSEISFENQNLMLFEFFLEDTSKVDLKKHNSIKKLLNMNLFENEINEKDKEKFEIFDNEFEDRFFKDLLNQNSRVDETEIKECVKDSNEKDENKENKVENERKELKDLGKKLEALVLEGILIRKRIIVSTNLDNIRVIKNTISEHYEESKEHRFLFSKHKIRRISFPKWSQSYLTEDFRFKCKKCFTPRNKLRERIFKSAKTLSLHLKNRHSFTKKNYLCESCPDLKFEKKSQLTKHKLQHNEKITCPDCPREFSSQYLFDLHYRYHLGVKPHSCDICKKLFTTPMALTTHRNMVHNNKSFLCDLCGRTFRLQRTLRVHSLTHLGGAQFPCRICGARFETYKKYLRHRQDHFGGPKTQAPAMCELCGKTYTNKYRLSAHVFAIHTEHEKKFLCVICGKMYKLRKDFLSHQYFHNGAEFKCPYCRNHYVLEENLKKHIEKKHSDPTVLEEKKLKRNRKSRTQKLNGDDEKRSKSATAQASDELIEYECKFCHKRFQKKSKILLHLNGHSDQRPYKCDLCPRDFKFQRYLWSHRFTHVKAKRFICNICNIGFTLKDAVQKHHIRQHRNEKLDFTDHTPAILRALGRKVRSRRKSDGKIVDFIDNLDEKVLLGDSISNLKQRNVNDSELGYIEIVKNSNSTNSNFDQIDKFVRGTDSGRHQQQQQIDEKQQILNEDNQLSKKVDKIKSKNGKNEEIYPDLVEYIQEKELIEQQNGEKRAAWYHLDKEGNLIIAKEDLTDEEHENAEVVVNDEDVIEQDKVFVVDDISEILNSKQFAVVQCLNNDNEIIELYQNIKTGQIFQFVKNES